MFCALEIIAVSSINIVTKIDSRNHPSFFNSRGTIREKNINCFSVAAT